MSEFKLTKAQDRARDALISDATHVCLEGGSRSGKTLLLMRQVLIRAIKSPGTHHAVFRFRFNSVKQAIIYQTLPKVIDLCFPDLKYAGRLNKSDWFYTVPNGSEIWFSGLDDKERVEKILGNEYATLYFNECSQIPWHSRVTAVSRLAEQTPDLAIKAFYDLNPAMKNHWVYKMFIEKLDPETKQPLINPANYAIYRINPIDNALNLAPEYLQELQQLPDRARRRFLYGEWQDERVGALWTEEMIDSTRVLGHAGTLPDWLRVVIAVDPSGSKGNEDERSDEIGIVVVALGTNNEGYVLEDLTGRYAPEDWGTVVAESFERHAADRIVGEENFGGDLVRAVIHSVDDRLPYSSVRATRGKVVRAEPISALYDQNKIHHVGYFQKLEDQMCAMTQSGYTGLKSPDRVDALVWGFTELFPGMTKSKRSIWVPPAVVSKPHSAARYQRRANNG